MFVCIRLQNSAIALSIIQVILQSGLRKSKTGSPVRTKFAHRHQNSIDGVSVNSFTSVSQDSISIASSEAERVITSEIIREKLEKKFEAQRNESQETERKNTLASEEDARILKQNLELNNVKRPSNEKLPVGQNVNMLTGKNTNSSGRDHGSDSSSTLEGTDMLDGGSGQKPVNTELPVPDTLPISVDNVCTPSDSDTMSPGYSVVREDGKLSVEHQPLLGAESDDPGAKSDDGHASPFKETANIVGDDAHNMVAVETNSANEKEDETCSQQNGHDPSLDNEAPSELVCNGNGVVRRKKTRNGKRRSPPKSDVSTSSESESMTVEDQLSELLQKAGIEHGDEKPINAEDTQEAEKLERPTELNVNQKRRIIHTASGDFPEESPSSDSANASPFPSPYKSLLYGTNSEKTVLHVDPSLNVSGHSDASSSTTPTTSNRDPLSLPSTPTESSTPSTPSPSEPPSPALPGDLHKSILHGNPESFAMTHNLTFPENSVTYSSPSKKKPSPRDQLLGVFSVDLGEMRSLRLFFSDDACTCGQLVIASRESQYKILHFHHGGLDKLAEVFEDWRVCVQQRNKTNLENEANQLCRKFSICRPHLPSIECHPEEGMFEMVSDDVWWSYVSDHGRIEDDFGLRKAIFLGGLDEYLRRDVWPFLLGYFKYDSTLEDRNAMRGKKREEYYAIQDKRELMSGDEYEQFWRNVQCTVEKDVVRTDRSHPYFRGENNPNLDVMRNILLNYAIYNPGMGYSQGMSDLLAPVLAEIQDESDSFWCFVGLMQNTIFVSSPTDDDMENQLAYLRALIELMYPEFWAHLMELGDAMELLFCHRWILLCFKREFPESDALRMWEACWAHYQTDYFHLFICVAIISVYGVDVVEQKLPSDEMLLHFSSLAMHMSGDMVLKKARGLLHQFRLLPRIPCSLHGLCVRCGVGMWDSGHTPEIYCVGNHEDVFKCPHSFSDEDLSDSAKKSPSPKTSLQLSFGFTKECPP
uniref:TBC1 domain family member 16-like n=1 Tax=Saccoglossus kowalevskii TaxID=10224 RepID=A0ABM0MVF9_SACKO|nr:PREDICTED: TBC1 domain family member 16-like [Saccoglossus kowalevskii]